MSQNVELLQSKNSLSFGQLEGVALRKQAEQSFTVSGRFTTSSNLIEGRCPEVRALEFAPNASLKQDYNTILRNITSTSRREVSTRGYVLAIVCQPVSTEKHRVRQPKMVASTKGR